MDIAALKKKYAEERDKRLRPDGNAQYIRLENQFAHLQEDPYVPRAPREPRTDHVTVAFVGGGFAGLVTGASAGNPHLSLALVFAITALLSAVTVAAADLTGLALELALWGAEPQDLAFLTPPPEGALAEGFSIPRESLVRSVLGKGERTACEYRTAHELTLWPLELSEARYLYGSALAAVGGGADHGVAAVPEFRRDQRSEFLLARGCVVRVADSSANGSRFRKILQIRPLPHYAEGHQRGRVGVDHRAQVRPGGVDRPVEGKFGGGRMLACERPVWTGSHDVLAAKRSLVPRCRRDPDRAVPVAQRDVTARSRGHAGAVDAPHERSNRVADFRFARCPVQRLSSSSSWAILSCFGMPCRW